MTTNVFNKLQIETENSNLNSEVIEELLAQLIAKEQALYLVDSEIEKVIVIDDLEDEINRTEQYKERIILLKTRVHRLLRTSLRQQPITESQNYSTVKDTGSRIKLPDIPLPTFSGQYEDWNNFKIQFNSIISNNSHLLEVEQLYYLKSSLRGVANQIETEDESFQSLYKALENRFENKRLIVDRHINSIINVEKINHESLVELRKLVDNILRNIRALKHWSIERHTFRISY
ncbi:uncharacterized protein LOC118200184 [Stegodyphus dumicola]|uniref:uncharacterized protein LOC118200184 n=1 Tax=Stegodyphus dumicola TaxID=202533 RepID=UPI0015AF5FE1|nr:uncharacterized protein LOC118200184 [Stegodyphus dumicola]